MSTSIHPPGAPRRGQRGIQIALLILLAGIAVWLWLRPLMAERALESAPLEELEKITAERPGYARAFYYLGMRYKRSGQNKPAFEALARAADLAPEDEEAWIAAAGAANKITGPEAAFRIMDDYLKRHPDSPKMQQERESLLGSLQRAADGFSHTGRYDEAIRYYKIGMEEAPNDTRAQEGLVKTLQAKGNKEEMFLTLDSLAQKNPKAAIIQRTLAELYAEGGFPVAARRHLQEVVQLTPNDPKAWHLLGSVSGGGDPVYAEEAFQKAVDRAPENALARLDLASVQVTNGKPDKAEENYRKALEISPKNPLVLSQLSGFLITSRPTPARLAEAETLAKQALSLDPKNRQTLYYLARVSLERDEPQKAIPLLKQASGDPMVEDEASVWYALYRAYGQQGDSVQAQKAQQKARAMRETRMALARAEEETYSHPQDPALRLKVARLYAQRGEYARAISQYEGCLALAPDNAEARAELESLSARLKALGKFPPMSLHRAMMAASARH